MKIAAQSGCYHGCINKQIMEIICKSNNSDKNRAHAMICTNRHERVCEGREEGPEGAVTVGVAASAGDSKLTEGGFADFTLLQ